MDSYTSQYQKRSKHGTYRSVNFARQIDHYLYLRPRERASVPTTFRDRHQNEMIFYINI